MGLHPKGNSGFWTFPIFIDVGQILESFLQTVFTYQLNSLGMLFGSHLFLLGRKQFGRTLQEIKSLPLNCFNISQFLPSHLT